jgi:hypothetical protein
MKMKRSLNFIGLASSAIMATSLASLADTETVTVKTTTTSSDLQALVLPTSSTYVLVDPITGNVKGNFDPVHGLTDVRMIQPGLVVLNQDTGRVIATLDSAGKPIDIALVPAFDTLVTGINARRSSLETMITDGLSKGTIKPAQSEVLRAELRKIEDQEQVAAQSDGIFTYSEALSVALKLNNLGERIAVLAGSTAVTPLLSARFVDTNSQIVMVDDVKYRQIQLQQRIDDEYAAGRLSTQQVGRLKEQLDEVATFESKYTKHGQLSSSRTEEASNKLDKTKTKLDQDIALINEKRSKMGIRVN